MTKSSNYNHAHQQSPQTSYPQQQTLQHAPPSYTSGKDSVTMKPRHSPSFVEMASDDTLSVETFRSPTSPRRRHQHSRFRRSASGSSFFDCDGHGNVRSPVEVYRDDESPADLSDTSSDEFSGLRATPPLCGDSGESSASPVTSHVNSPMVGAVRRVPNSCVENHCSVKPCSPPRASSDDGVWKAYENKKEVQCKPMMSKEQVEHMERTNLLGVLACIIEQLCPANEVLPTDPHYLSLFHTSAIPSISIRDYLFRLASYTSVSSECLIQTVIHIQNLSRRGRAEVAAAAASASGLASPTSHISRQRSYSTTSSAQSSSLSSPSSALSHSNAFNEALLTQSAADLARPHPRINSFSNQPFQVCIHNIHRLLLTAILVTAKFVDDAFYNNRIYSTLGGVSVRELNRLECEFLAITDYRLMITAQEFQREWELMNHPMRHGAWCMQPNHPCGPVMAIDSGYDESLDDDLDEMFVSTPSSSRTSSVSTPIGSPSAAHRRATSDAIMQCGSHCSSTAMTPVESPRQQQRPQRHHQHSYSLSHHPLHVKVAPTSSDQSSDAYCTQTRRLVPSVPSSTSASSKPFSASHLA